MVGLPEEQAKNELEQAFLDAIDDAGLRPRFYELLLESNLLVLGVLEDEESARSLQIGRMEYDGRVLVPVFSSVERMEEFVDQEQDYVGLNARVLFESCGTDVTYVLNPGSRLGREFPPAEIGPLLDGTFFDVGSERTELVGQEIELSEPSTDTTLLVQALCSFFDGCEDVRSAYLAQMYIPGSSDPPHVVIGMHVDGDCAAVIKAAAYVVGQVAVEGEPVDFVDVASGGEIADYMVREVEPFYRR